MPKVVAAAAAILPRLLAMMGRKTMGNSWCGRDEFPGSGADTQRRPQISEDGSPLYVAPCRRRAPGAPGVCRFPGLRARSNGVADEHLNLLSAHREADLPWILIHDFRGTS